jgi:hypothetical protein
MHIINCQLKIMHNIIIHIYVRIDFNVNLFLYYYANTISLHSKSIPFPIQIDYLRTTKRKCSLRASLSTNPSNG